MDCSPPGSSVDGISQQEYWSGLPFPSPGDLSNPGIEPASPALAGEFFTTEPSGPAEKVTVELRLERSEGTLAQISGTIPACLRKSMGVEWEGERQ